MRDELPPGGPPPHVQDMSSDMDDVHNSIFFAAVATTRMPMIVTDPNQDDNPIVFSNPAFLHMTGYDEEELVGHNCRLLQGPETDREVVAQVKEAIAARREIAVEILNYKKNGSSFWNALFVSPVFDKKGELLYFFASQLDVTRRRDAEDALHQSQKMEAVGQLTGGIAHDFNNLLTVIQGFAELLEANIDSNNFDRIRAKRAISAILQATSRGAELTAQLLAFARRQKLQGRVVSLPDLVDQLIPLVEQSLGNSVEVDVRHNAPQCNARIDPVQAELAILNIAVNARDAMSGNGTLFIETDNCVIRDQDTRFGIVDPGTYVFLSIKDTGSGMDPETLQRITEPFFTTKGEGKGTGLGMSMVYGFVKQSGGFINVESEIGKGTTVTMLFRCDNSAAEPATIRAHKSVVGRKGEKETILVVEDKAAVAEYAEAVLSDFGYTVIKAENADLAMAVLKEHDDIDVLFSDIIMPGSMNGVQLAREALKLRPTIKVLLTTGYTDSAIEITDDHGTPFDLVNKPYRRVELTNRLRQTIDGPDGIS